MQETNDFEAFLKKQHAQYERLLADARRVASLFKNHPHAVDLRELVEAIQRALNQIEEAVPELADPKGDNTGRP
jgi:hypothetical protein